MSKAQADENGEGTDRRKQENVDRRSSDRRQDTKPYTGPERRKHERRES